jgi:signal peptidase I
MEAILEELTNDNVAIEPQQLSIAWVRFILDVLETILLAAILFLTINALSARVRVEGFSMVPTLQDGEFVLVNRLAYQFGERQRGDIIVFHHPSGQKQEDLIKRIIGLPGDRVKAEGGSIYVNDVQLKEETYIEAAPAYSGEWVVPEGQLFVLGDNRNNSSDSHQWGFVQFDDVVGKAVVIYWPLNELLLIEHPDLIKMSSQ